MKKTVFFISISLLILSFFSCSVEKVEFQDEEIVTLRKTISQVSDKIYWTQELDSSILESRVNGADGISKSMTADPSNIFASGAESFYEPVYPAFEDFALLDTSSLVEVARNNLAGFCNSVVEKRPADSYMDPNEMYALVIFNYDVNREGKKFTGYVLGEPFETDSLLQCPVRFFEKGGAFQDVLVYLNSKKEYKVSAIEFVLREKEDEPS